jgi:hypothetical protein
MQIPILSNKRSSVAVFMRGGFGNKLRAWDTVAKFECEGSPCENVTLMYKTPRGGQGPCIYGVAANMVATRARELVADGWEMDRITVYETAPDHRLLINGELGDDWYFFYSRLRLPMREALRKGGQHMQGLRTRHTLRSLLTPSSWADLLALRDLYSHHVIELSVYEILLGNLRARNMIAWEVRDY